VQRGMEVQVPGKDYFHEISINVTYIVFVPIPCVLRL